MHRAEFCTVFDTLGFSWAFCAWILKFKGSKFIYTRRGTLGHLSLHVGDFVKTLEFCEEFR